MTRGTLLSLVAALAVIAATPSSGPAAAQFVGTPGRPAATDAEAVALIERHIEVTGGRAAYQRLTSRRITGTMEQDGARYGVVINAAPPAMRHVVLTMPDGRTQRFVTNGVESWTYRGAYVIASSGRQRRQELRRSVFDPMLHWDEHYRTARLVDDAERAGDAHTPQRAHVRLVAADGHELDLWFDVASGRLAATAQSLVNAGVEMTSTTSFEAWRRIDGVELPVRVVRTITYPGGRLVQRYAFETIEHDVAMPPDLFRTPFELGGDVAAR